MKKLIEEKYILFIIPIVFVLVLLIGKSYALFTKSMNTSREVSIKTGRKYIGIYGENKSNIGIGTTYSFKLQNRGLDPSGYELYLDDKSASIDLTSVTCKVESSLTTTTIKLSDLASPNRKILSGLLNNEEEDTIKITLSSTATGTYIGKLRIKYTNFSLNKNYDYTGNYQTFTAPTTATYRIDAWGAQGGSITGTGYNSDGTVRSSSLTYTGGKGAYTTGNIKLNRGDTIYIYVGGTVSQTNISTSGGVIEGGYNGGASLIPGQQVYGAPGGGATDIRIASGSWDNFDSLKSRIMVAAGGGGANFRNQGYGEGNGGSGGTLTGNKGQEALTVGSYWRLDYSPGYELGTGGEQTKGGLREIHYLNGTVSNTAINGTFGGANSITNQSGGGGGYYSGGSSRHGGAGGGSSFISGYYGCNAISSASTPTSIAHTGLSTHYSGVYFIDSSMISGDNNIPNKNGFGVTKGNSGNGYAKITLLKDGEYSYTGNYQTYTAKKAGTYKVELWGAAGGNYSTYTGGRGAYTTGNIYLSANEKLYVYVGTTGATFNVNNTLSLGQGGGATDIRLANGLWDEFNSLKSRIMVAAAGGGAYDRGEGYGAGNGGSAGIIEGYSGESTNHTNGYGYSYGTGGTQTQGGKLYWLEGNSGTASTGYYTSLNAFGVKYNVGGIFGKGGDGMVNQACGASGYYGGGGATHGGAGGGSSFISGITGFNAISSSSTQNNIIHLQSPNHYSGKVFTNAYAVDGKGYKYENGVLSSTVTGMPSFDGTSTINGNSSSGFARITYIN